ncbi:putative Ecp7(P20) [Drepanopeziza brunnea f. sp. 'multigermtubi' MB_m1]|uniref:Putative Ecp7(P20) n=1 Tax=Marssonina brunnea f. sp. multigermtubi (strain MB_m1) TaxID=1072389 RepID=K1WYD7_MARBU|nr:putative Ecp7(P20) [Drepanopeziza brunnea f. sp. 'multigermtubi' MB_m1]EKD18036.1 putative Ecp7(P20) [Drepanopeziza brunnea f. sp. 'multigermtubi' MB_m1]
MSNSSITVLLHCTTQPSSYKLNSFKRLLLSTNSTMRFNNSLFLLASFLGVATAFRRSCRPNASGKPAGTGFYTITTSDTWENIAADFCSSAGELKVMNHATSFETGAFLSVPCKTRKRDCSRIQGDSEGNGYYTVVAGDDLANIAGDFCTDANTLQQKNPTTSSNPQAGAILVVPCGWN